MFATLKQYIESKKGTPETGKTIADHVLELKEEELQIFEDLYADHYQAQLGNPTAALPLKGKNVLFNQHQDRITWLFMLFYQALGANVEASKIGVAELPFARDAFVAAHIPYFQESLNADQLNDYYELNDEALNDRAKGDYYDLAFDCCAGLLKHAKPKQVLELTFSDPKRYTSTVSGAETINNTITKLYETYFGTGRAMVDSLKPLIRKKLDEGVGLSNTALDDEEKAKLTEARFSQAYYIVVGGAGKVAAGVIYALLEAGVPKAQILLVDENKEPFAHAMPDTQHLTYLNARLEDGPQAFKQAILTHMQTHQPNKLFTEQNFLRKVSIITATGISGLLTKNNFKPADLHECSLINVGHTDEAGSNFKSNDMMGTTKGPINFNLRRMEEHGYPTEPKYVLPSLSLLALRGIVKLKSAELGTTGLKDIPFEVDMQVFNKMCSKNDLEALKLQPIAQARRQTIQNHAEAQPINAAPPSPTHSLSSQKDKDELDSSSSTSSNQSSRKRPAEDDADSGTKKLTVFSTTANQIANLANSHKRTIAPSSASYSNRIN